MSGAGVGTRPMLYCVLPSDLALVLHEPLRRHFADDSAVEVVVEQRRRERRVAGERRIAAGEVEPALERRRINSPTGRRVADRRASSVPVGGRELPRKARRHADRILFVERLEPSARAAEDVDTARLVTRIQAGSSDDFVTLYMRYFERVYGYLRVLLRDPHEAEDATQQVFLQVLEKLPTYERREQPFRAWLFAVVRNYALAHLRRHKRLQPTDPSELTRQQEQNGVEAADELPALDWISDRDLVVFIERLPLAQRQVLLLRYMLGLTTAEIAEVLERSQDNVRALQSRALGFLRQRLAAVGRLPSRDARRPRMRRYLKQAPVLRSRRYALH